MRALITVGAGSLKLSFFTLDRFVRIRAGVGVVLAGRQHPAGGSAKE